MAGEERRICAGESSRGVEKSQDGFFSTPLLEMRGAGKEILGDAPLAMLFGIGISGAIAEIGKAVFPPDIRGQLRHASHDCDKEITGV